MPGDGGETGADQVLELADAALALGQSSHDPQAGRMSQCAENLGAGLEEAEVSEGSVLYGLHISYLAELLNNVKYPAMLSFVRCQ